MKKKGWWIVVSTICVSVLLITMYQLWFPEGFKSIYFRLYRSCDVAWNVTYKTVDNINLKMDIYRPVGINEPTPVVVYIHGGGWYSGDKSSDTGQAYIPELIDHGYVVAAIDYRLAPSYKFPAQYEDVNSAIEYLRSNAGTYNIDLDSIGLLGDSAGGHLASLVALADYCICQEEYGECYHTYSEVQAVVDLYGPTDISKICGQDKTMHIEHVFGTCDPDSLILERASPVSHVSNDDPPFFIIHGDQDTQVPLEQSELLYKKLSAEGIPVTLMVVNNTTHGFKSAGGPVCMSHDQITDNILQFLDEHLKPSI